MKFKKLDLLLYFGIPLYIIAFFIEKYSLAKNFSDFGGLFITAYILDNWKIKHWLFFGITSLSLLVFFKLFFDFLHNIIFS